MKIANIKLENYCGYESSEFNFLDGSGNPKNLIAFYGPNGIGKSSVLHAINLLGNFGLRNRFSDTDYNFGKVIYSEGETQGSINYDLNKRSAVMTIDGTFHADSGEKKIIVSSDSSKNVAEFDTQEAEFDAEGFAFYIDADNAAIINRFSLSEDYEETFKDIAMAVYGYECILPDPIMNISEINLFQEQGIDEKFYEDLIIVKGKTKVHFKSMSAGEKKIATLIRELCKLKKEKKHIDIALVDNIEMHVYMKRHAKLMDKILEHFGDKQIICTTHSPVLVGTDEIKGYLDKQYLYDIETYKT